MKSLLTKSIPLLFLLATAIPVQQAEAQTEPYIGQLMLVGFNFCPVGWTPAEGQLLAINTNSALFSLYGTMYGGDGRTTFGLPDLRGRVPFSAGQGPGLSNYIQGAKGGAEIVTLNATEMPSHNHALTELTNPNGTTPGLVIRNGGGATTQATTNAGGNLPHENRSPFLAMKWCVAVTGVFPSRS